MKSEEKKPSEPQVSEIFTASGNDCDPAFLDTISGVRYVALQENHLPSAVQKRLARVLLLLDWCSRQGNRSPIKPQASPKDVDEGEIVVDGPIAAA